MTKVEEVKVLAKGELKETANSKVIEIVVESETGYEKDGSLVPLKEPAYHTIVAWGEQADAVNNDVSVGDKIKFEGKESTSKYENKNGELKTQTRWTLWRYKKLESAPAKTENEISMDEIPF